MHAGRRSALRSGGHRALGAKLARADGRADPVEYRSFVELFPPEPDADQGCRPAVIAWPAEAARLRGAAGASASATKNCPKLLESVVDRLFYAARADGRQPATRSPTWSAWPNCSARLPLNFAG